MTGITSESVLVIKLLILSAVSIISRPLGNLFLIKSEVDEASSLAKLIKASVLIPFFPYSLPNSTANETVLPVGLLERIFLIAVISASVLTEAFMV